MSKLTELFHSFTRDLMELELGWTDELERSGVHHAIADARHHVAHAFVWLETDAASDVARVLAREAFLSALELGQIVQRAAEHNFASAHAIEHGDAGVTAMLDA